MIKNSEEVSRLGLFDRKRKTPLRLSQILEELEQQGFIEDYEKILFYATHTLTPVIVALWKDNKDSVGVEFEKIVERYAQLSNCSKVEVYDFVNRWVSNLVDNSLIAAEGGIIRDKALSKLV